MQLSKRDLTLGIIFILFGIFSFAAMDVGLKWYSEKGYSTAEICFFRSVFSLFPILILVARSGGIRQLTTYRPLAHVIRGSVDYISLVMMILALHYIPLMDAMAIAFTAPIIVTSLSVPFLKETVGVHRWIAVLIGFTGGLLIIQPGFGNFNVGSLAAAACAVSFAMTILLTRLMSFTETSTAIVFWSAILWIVLSGLVVPFYWKTPEGWDWLGFILVGIFGGFAQLFLSEGLRLIPPSIATPYEYTALIWAAIFGFLIFGDIPNLFVILGSLIVVSSGLYIIYREKKKCETRT